MYKRKINPGITVINNDNVCSGCRTTELLPGEIICSKCMDRILYSIENTGECREVDIMSVGCNLEDIIDRLKCIKDKLEETFDTSLQDEVSDVIEQTEGTLQVFNAINIV